MNPVFGGNAATLTGLGSCSVTGQDAVLILKVEEGREIALRMPAALLGQLQSLAFDLREQMESRGLNKAYLRYKTPRAFSVGHSDYMRGHVAISFDQDTINEQVFMLRDQDAVKLCQQIMLNVRDRIGEPRTIIIPGG